MVITMAVPIAPEICRTVLFTAVPCVTNVLGKEFNPAVFNGMVMKLKPIRRKMVRIIKKIHDVVSDKSVTTHIDGMMNSKPVINKGFAPKRSYIFPVTGDIKALIGYTKKAGSSYHSL